MKAAVRSKVEKEVDKKLSVLAAASGGKVPDEMREKAIDEAYDKAIENNFSIAVDEAFEKAKKSDDYKNTLSDFMSDAKKEIDKQIDEEYKKIADRYDLYDKDFKPTSVKLYPLFYSDGSENFKEKNIGTIRVYGERKGVDLYDILDGKAPENENEIIIDRMHADNIGLKVGDTLEINSMKFIVTGFAAFVDYSSLYINNNDTMFDAITFDVGMTTDKGLERINGDMVYKYAFTYNETPQNSYEEKTFSDNFLKALITQTIVIEEKTEIESYIPSYANKAITFASEDMGTDKAMSGVMLYILTAVLAFIFAVTISSTLEKECTVIGTLRALGYTKAELLIYYMSGPMLVMIVSAIVGNILGYTVFKESVVDMYYNSYSLPSYRTIWTPDAFFKTTIVPMILMFVINIVIISNTLKLSPLRFLRRDIKRTKRQKAIRLPKWGFMKRFRIRVFIQNIPNYIMLFVGICFIMILLSMAVGMPTTLDYYQDNVVDMMFVKEQIILKSTENSDGKLITTKTMPAESFSLDSLELRTKSNTEEVSVYGIIKNSKYIKLDSEIYNVSDKKNVPVYISKAYSEKYGVHTGDIITLNEKYESKDYTWKVYGIYDYSVGVVVFMANDTFNEVFDKDKGSFSGYMSNEPINDIDEDYIAKRITSDDLTKMALQLDHSMGSYMVYFQYVCVIVAAIIIYLLTKLIIEKNEVAIAMTKILGYSDKEIALLYLVTTGIVVLISEIAALFIGYKLMCVFWRVMLMSLGGWINFKMTTAGFVEEFFMVFAAYIVIAIVDYIRLKKVPKVLALKNVE